MTALKSGRQKSANYTQGLPSFALLTSEQISCRLTGSGWMLCVMGVLMALIAFLYHINVLLLFGFLSVSLCLVNWLHNYYALQGLRIEVGFAPPVFVGDDVCHVLIITNHNPGRRDDLVVKLESELRFALEHLESRTVHMLSRAQQRGWQSMANIFLSTGYPLGLSKAMVELALDSRVLVYPEPIVESSRLPAVDNIQDLNAEGYSRGGVADFSGHRAYRVGDNPAHIDWKAYAKGHGMLAKEFDHEAVGKCLIFDFAETALDGDLEQRLSRLCRWLLDADQAGLQYGLRLPEIEIPCGSGELHLCRCLQELSLI
jgi:uncharacterized protein (DUF58 family)